uniref:Uncharacterized protein n=1 Tax=Sphaerodactylus townsendi TaxID=933632 RepID=A0ACB8FF38_9SAUR
MGRGDLLWSPVVVFTVQKRGFDLAPGHRWGVDQDWIQGMSLQDVWPPSAAAFLLAMGFRGQAWAYRGRLPCLLHIPLPGPNSNPAVAKQVEKDLGPFSFCGGAPSPSHLEGVSWCFAGRLCCWCHSSVEPLSKC